MRSSGLSRISITIQQAADMVGERFAGLVKQFEDNKRLLTETGPNLAETLLWEEGRRDYAYKSCRALYMRI